MVDIHQYYSHALKIVLEAGEVSLVRFFYNVYILSLNIFFFLVVVKRF